MNQSDFGSKSMHVWLPPYRVERVLTHSNYIIRKVGTNFTQCIHRIRLRSYEPHEPPEDLPNVDPERFVPDPVLGKYRQEPELFDEEIPKLLEHTFMTDVPEQQEQEEQQNLSVTTSFSYDIPPAPAVPVAPPAIVPLQEPAPLVLNPEPPDPVQEQFFPEPIDLHDQPEIPDVDVHGFGNNNEEMIVFNDAEADNQVPIPPVNQEDDNPFADFPEPFQEPMTPRRGRENPRVNQPMPEIQRNQQRGSDSETPLPPFRLQKRVRFPPDADTQPQSVVGPKRKGYTSIEVPMVDGRFVLPHATFTRQEKHDAITSSRDSTRRLAYQQGPSRATKHDIKRSEEKKKASESPTTSTSVEERETRFTKSPKEPSPLLQLVPGSKRRARLNKVKAEKNKSGDMKSMFEPNFNLLYTTSDIEKSKNSIVQAVSMDSPLANLEKLNIVVPPSTVLAETLTKGSLISIHDKKEQRFVYNLVSKKSKLDRPSYIHVSRLA